MREGVGGGWKMLPWKFDNRPKNSSAHLLLPLNEKSIKNSFKFFFHHNANFMTIHSNFHKYQIFPFEKTFSFASSRKILFHA